MQRMENSLSRRNGIPCGWLALQLATSILLIFSLLLPAAQVSALENVTLAIPNKSFQQTTFSFAQDSGYMREEGLDLKMVFIEPTPSVQALVGGSVQFTGAGTSALIAITRAAAPLKVVLALNDRVHHWLYTRPEITDASGLKGKKIATTGVASIATFMLKEILSKHGFDASRDVFYIDVGAGNQLQALVAKAVDASVLFPEQRYAGLDSGMKEMFYFGNEVKNSWGTVATSDRLIKEQPKLVTGYLKAALKALRRFRQDKATTVAAVNKFSGLDRNLAGRMYDDLIGTFTANGTVDVETQRNDLALVRQVLGVKETIPVERAYDFSLASEADRQLNQAGWRP